MISAKWGFQPLLHSSNIAFQQDDVQAPSKGNKPCAHGHAALKMKGKETKVVDKIRLPNEIASRAI